MPRQFCRLLTGVSKIRGIHFAGLIAQAACLGFPKTRYVHFAGPSHRLLYRSFRKLSPRTCIHFAGISRGLPTRVSESLRHQRCRRLALASKNSQHSFCRPHRTGRALWLSQSSLRPFCRVLAGAALPEFSKACNVHFAGISRGLPTRVSKSSQRQLCRRLALASKNSRHSFCRPHRTGRALWLSQSSLRPFCRALASAALPEFPKPRGVHFAALLHRLLYRSFRKLSPAGHFTILGL